MQLRRTPSLQIFDGQRMCTCKWQVKLRFRLNGSSNECERFTVGGNDLHRDAKTEASFRFHQAVRTLIRRDMIAAHNLGKTRPRLAPHLAEGPSSVNGILQGTLHSTTDCPRHDIPGKSLPVQVLANTRTQPSDPRFPET